MEALILTVFVSVVLVLSSIVFFGWNVRQRTHEHSERLALLPLQQEGSQRSESDSEPGRN